MDSHLNGFIYLPEFISLEEENYLLRGIHDLEWRTVKMYGVTAKRKVVHFGLDYNFQNRSVFPTTAPPPFLNFLIERANQTLNAANISELEVLVSSYPIGAGIGWHRDAPMFDKVFGVSLGNDSVMKFRMRDEHKVVHKLMLESRSAYLLSGPIREEWEHTIPAVKLPRYSITIRTLKLNRIKKTSS